jgi:glutaredoxin
MHLKRNLILSLGIGLLLIGAVYGGAAAQSDADDPAVVITFFWREGCSHCADEKPFLQALMVQNPRIDLRAYEVYDSRQNLDYLFALGGAMGFETSGVPVTVIGGQAWVGFSEEIGAELSAAVAACSTDGCGDPADQYGLDTSGTVLSLQDLGGSESQPSVKAPVPVWVWGLGVVALLLISYGVGALLRNTRKKPARKRH